MFHLYVQQLQQLDFCSLTAKPELKQFHTDCICSLTSKPELKQFHADCTKTVQHRLHYLRQLRLGVGNLIKDFYWILNASHLIVIKLGRPG